MAAALLPFRPTTVRPPRASSVDRNPCHRSPSSGNWWTPVFGWSSDPDYIDSPARRCPSVEVQDRSVPDLVRKPSGSRFAPGCFTPEKARQLRKMTMEAASSHDMYHSAIASRLATDFPHHSDP